jgi:hypothetical protein
MRFKILTQVLLRTVFWDVTVCRCVTSQQHLNCLHISVPNNKATET